MSLHEINDDLKALAVKLDVDGEKVLNFIKREIKIMLETDDADACANLRGYIEGASEHAPEHTPEPTPAPAGGKSGEVVSLLDKMKGAVGLA